MVLVKLAKVLACLLLLMQLWFLQGFFYTRSYAEHLAVEAARGLSREHGLGYKNATRVDEAIGVWREKWEPVWLSLEDVFGGRDAYSRYSNEARIFYIEFCDSESGQIDSSVDSCGIYASLLASGRVHVMLEDDRFSRKWNPPSLVPPPDGVSRP